MRERVGASIVEIITESLYDKPIVVFREYVQNSADSLSLAEKNGASSDLAIKIWRDEGKNSLYFLDNGTGIVPEEFALTMGSIADSAKLRSKNIGYKGIGRLSGLAYCQKLTFVNIVDYDRDRFQTYSINCKEYTELRKKGALNNLQFSDLMAQISTFDNKPNASEIKSLMSPYSSLFNYRNTGFLVVLSSLSPVLNTAISEKSFLENLSWLLPVPFEEELLQPIDNDDTHMLFTELGSVPAFPNGSTIPAKAFSISYNSNCLKRPITRELLRSYLCKSNLDQYAVCVHTFSNLGIAINSKNPFSGIRMYIDNILLCDESELIPALQQFGMISHTVNETIQAVRGIGAAIYIVDKVNISANARRTFIDVTDEDSLSFLKLVGEFVENVFQARYALSGYYSAKKKAETTEDILSGLREKAENALVKLACQDIVLEEVSVPSKDFISLPASEKRKIIKSRISKDINTRIKRYIEQTIDFNLESYFEDFLTWLIAN